MRNCQVCRQVSECILMDGNVHNLAHRSVLLPGRSRSNFESFHLIVFLANRWNSTNFETVFNRRFSGDADLLIGKGRKVATLSIPRLVPSPLDYVAIRGISLISYQRIDAFRLSPVQTLRNH